ncbi:hypothetical protein OCAR_6937 [Afipia carboxidovorans OM5]|nr:hypothetical protein OCAR_6937 [Afipia carboxidovorans OM5]
MAVIDDFQDQAPAPTRDHDFLTPQGPHHSLTGDEGEDL